MKVTLINPNLCRQAGDLLGSGVPYMPVLLAYLAGSLRRQGIDVLVVDAFGEAPERLRKEDNLWIHGLTVDRIVDKVEKKSPDLIAIYGQSVASFIRLCQIIKALKRALPKNPIIVLENTQAVTAFSLKNTASELFSSGTDYLLAGEADYTLPKFCQSLSYGKIDYQLPGLIYKSTSGIKDNPINFIHDLDNIAYPLWEIFPLEKYWQLGYSHGPVSGKFLPILTSRGCPYNCAFCVVPATNQRRWRFKSAKRVVNEMEYLSEKFKVSDFHLEDLNPGMNKFRLQQIASEIIRRKLSITWKIVAGTKIEHVSDEETLEWMRKSGCVYISISPESGSPRVLKLMDKHFDHHFALKMISKMNTLGIFSQACFVLGFPGETDRDLEKTKQYIKKLTQKGVDEIALFIMTPIPGSKTFGTVKGYHNYSQLTFSPSWRSDYGKLSRTRVYFYLIFLVAKLVFQLKKVLRQIKSVLTGNFNTKMEMVLFRTLKNLWLQQKSLLFQ